MNMLRGAESFRVFKEMCGRPSLKKPRLFDD